ncbi:MAG: hypothetical protein KKD48_04690 [Nanoarchaeota archaeon]|nr:hypothetical protein [Nanoarchaeota archaeon]
MLNLFKKKDPICGMTEEKGKGITKYEKWFCSKDCLKKFEKQQKSNSCCHP